MHFSQIIILIFALSLSFTVTAKPSWKDTSTATEKPGGKGKNRDNTTSEPIVDTTSDPGGDIVSEPIDDTASEPIADTAPDPGGDTISEPIADTTPEPGADTTSEPIADTTSEPTTDTTSEPTTDTRSEPIADTTSEPIADTTSEPTTDTTSEPIAATGTATLSWGIPVSRENGDFLTFSELGGYSVLVRDTANNTEFFIMIDDPNITEWTFEALTAGLWEFSIATVDVQGVYSNYSTVVSKVIY